MSLLMMHEFLSEHRGELIERCRFKVSKRVAPESLGAELEHGITVFLDQIIKTLKVEETSRPMESRKVSGESGGVEAVFSEMGDAAKQHGRELLKHGFTIDQVVHDYGDLCQSVTDLAVELNAQMLNGEFRTLNRCLDNAIAVAATEFSAQRENLFADKEVHANERLGFFAHELRNHLNSAMLALTAIKGGSVGLTGATGAVLDRSLVALCTLIDRSLAEARMTAGLPVRNRLFSLADFIAEVKLSATLEAQINRCTLTVSYVNSKLAVEADRELLLSAVGNLLQNAFKFTHPFTDVTLKVYAVADRVLIEVEDKCGGLPDGAADEMFLPFTQSGANKTGAGLGLSIARRSVEANAGTLTVRDIAGSGCVFTIDLPRQVMPEPSLSGGELSGVIGRESPLGYSRVLTHDVPARLKLEEQVEQIRRDVRRNGESFASCDTLQVLCEDQGTCSHQLDRITDIAEYEGWSFALLNDGRVRFAKLTGAADDGLKRAG